MKKLSEAKFGSVTRYATDKVLSKTPIVRRFAHTARGRIDQREVAKEIFQQWLYWSGRNAVRGRRLPATVQNILRFMLANYEFSDGGVSIRELIQDIANNVVNDKNRASNSDSAETPPDSEEASQSRPREPRHPPGELPSGWEIREGQAIAPDGTKRDRIMLVGPDATVRASETITSQNTKERIIAKFTRYAWGVARREGASTQQTQQEQQPEQQQPQEQSNKQAASDSEKPYLNPQQQNRQRPFGRRNSDSGPQLNAGHAYIWRTKDGSTQRVIVLSEPARRQNGTYYQKVYASGREFYVPVSELTPADKVNESVLPNETLSKREVAQVFLALAGALIDSGAVTPRSQRRKKKSGNTDATQTKRVANANKIVTPVSSTNVQKTARTASHDEWTFNSQRVKELVNVIGPDLLEKMPKNVKQALQRARSPEDFLKSSMLTQQEQQYAAEIMSKVLWEIIHKRR